MAYLPFNRIEPPAPNDPQVNEQTQLNGNWDLLDSKLKPYYQGGFLNNVEVGQEFFSGVNFDFGVWDGAATVTPEAIPEGWTAWTNLPVATGRSARGGFTPRWRNNPLYRMVELSGGFLYDGAASAWPNNAAHLLNAPSAGSPPTSMVPVGGKHIQPCAVALTEGTINVAGGLVVVDIDSGFVRIRGQYMGGPGGGNFIMLDQVWWWY